MKQNLLIFTLFFVIGVAVAAESQQEAVSTPPLPPRPTLQRVVLLTPPSLTPLEPRVRAWQEAMAAMGKGRIRFRTPHNTEKDRTNKFDRLQKGKQKAPPTEPPIQDRELIQLGQSAFLTALGSQLKAQNRTELISAEIVAQRMQAQNLTYAQCTKSEGAILLAKALNADVVLWLKKPEVLVYDRTERTLFFRMQIHVAAEEQGEGNYVGTDYDFPVCGTAYTNKSLLLGTYSKTLPLLTTEAAILSAARTAHTLRTGELMPLLPPTTRLAVFPTPAPTSADRLLFTPHGSIKEANSSKDLPYKASLLFGPSLLPLLPPAITAAKVVNRALTVQNLTPETVWNREGGWNPNVVIPLGKQIGVDYLLLTRIKRIEMEGTLAQSNRSIPTTLQQEERGQEVVFQVRAEAEGYLVRVRDGATLWKDTQEATFGIRRDQLRPSLRTTERGLVQSTVRFALLHLDQSLTHYFALYER